MSKKISTEIQNMDDIWPTLYELTKTPEIEILLQKIYDKFIYKPYKKNINNFEETFRYDEKTLVNILTEKKPWLKYSWPMMSQVEGVNKDDSDDIKKSKEIDIQCQKIAVEKAKSPANKEWWAMMHQCTICNGILLMTLLQKAFPKKKFRVAFSEVHVWVEDSNCRVYDLYWPAVDINDLHDAIFTSNGKLQKITYSKTPLIFSLDKRIVILPNNSPVNTTMNKLTV